MDSEKIQELIDAAEQLRDDTQDAESEVCNAKYELENLESKLGTLSSIADDLADELKGLKTGPTVDAELIDEIENRINSAVENNLSVAVDGISVDLTDILRPLRED